MVNSINEQTGRETYWLHIGERLLTAVRLPPGAIDQEVRWAALDQHERVPLQPPEYTPHEWSRMLHMASVKQYPDKN